MLTKTQLKSVLDAMTKEELRDALLEALSESDGALDRFIAAHSESEDDLEDAEMIRMIKRRAEGIADQIRANIGDEETMWHIACSGFEGDEAFDALVEDELEEAKDYAAGLARTGRVKLAVKFAQVADELIGEALASSDYPWDVACFDITNIWESILGAVAEDDRAKVFELLLEEAEAEEEPFSTLDFLCNRAEPAFAQRLLKLVDKRIAGGRDSSGFRRALELPFGLRKRKAVMEAAGASEAEFNAYIVSNFGDCAFGLVRILEQAEAQKDAKAAAAACKALLAFNLDVRSHGEYAAKLARYQAASGDKEGEAQTLREAVAKQAAGLSELRRLRELIPASEWEAIMKGFIQTARKWLEAYPGLRVCGELLADAKDYEQLWEVVRASPRRKDWLAFRELLGELHPDEYGDFLLAHLDVDHEFGFRNKRTMGEVYAVWAETIQLAAGLPGQREKAMDVARKIARGKPGSRALKVAWLEAGLPGFEKAGAKRAKPKANS